MSWQPIEEQTLAAPASSITFNTGLSGYAFYRLTVYVVNDGDAKTVQITLNNDTDTNYDTQRVSANGSTVNGNRGTAAFWRLNCAVQTAASQHQSATALIAKPAASPAQFIAQSGFNASPVLELFGGQWDDTSDPISRIDIGASDGNFAAGTSVMLEGLAA